MVKNSNKDRILEPVLVKNPRKNESSREFINIAPFLDSIDFVNNNVTDPMEDLCTFISGLARYMATVYMEGGITMDGWTKEDIVYALFHLEEGLRRSTLVQM